MTVERASRDAAVVILVADQHTTLRALAGDVGLACFALGVEAVDLLLQPFLGGLAGVDGAAELSAPRASSCAPPVVLEPEEGPAVPAGPGDLTGDAGKRLVRPPLPFEPVGGDGDHMLDALPLSEEPGPRNRPVAIGVDAALLPVAAVQFLTKPCQPTNRLRLQPADGRGQIDAASPPSPRTSESLTCSNRCPS